MQPLNLSDKFKSISESDKNRFRSFVDEKALKKEMKKAGPCRGLNKYLKTAEPEWKKGQLKIAVSGGSGAGKSSLINALRNISDNDETAADFGVVETTHAVKEYSYKENSSVKLYDLPGAGTPEFPMCEYLDKVNITQFDVVIIVFATRFLENDLWFAEKCLNLSKNVLFVRTKIDIDIMNEKRRRYFNYAKCLQKIKENTEQHIKAGKIGTKGCKLFFVSSVERTEYDFKKLNEELQNMLSIRGVVIAGCIKEIVNKHINEKEENQKDGNDDRKIVSAVIGFLPVPFLETYLDSLSVSNMRESCMKDFGIDKHLLEEMKNDNVITDNDILNMETFNNKDFKDGNTIHETTESRFSTVQRYSKYFLPVVGSIYSAYKSYITMEECVDKVAGKMATDGRFLLEKRLEHLLKSLQPLKK